MNSNDIDKFIERNVQNFRLNGTGWNDIVRRMLFEFGIAGWDLNSMVGGKEKFGELRCYLVHEDKELEEKAKKIVRKYAEIAEKTCEQCGCTARKRFDRQTQCESTLCKGCYFKSVLKANKNSLEKTGNSNLSECKICGYIAVAEDHCGFCNNNTFLSNSSTYRPAEHFKTEEEYIKECQVEVFLDEENEIELSKKTKHFRKSDSHQIVFSLEDLERYFRDLREH